MQFKPFMLTVTITLLLVFCGELFLYYAPSLFSGEFDSNEKVKTELISLASTALQTHDVPVASVLLYKGNIIGRGYNTVIRDTNAGAHAEINAISDALKKYSRKEFAELVRDSLLLVSTYEPCPMCRGAILEYNIRKVEFWKAKSIWHLLKEDLRYDRYLWERKYSDEGNLQDSLFYLHPGYTNRK